MQGTYPTKTFTPYTLTTTWKNHTLIAISRPFGFLTLIDRSSPKHTNPSILLDPSNSDFYIRPVPPDDLDTENLEHVLEIGFGGKKKVWVQMESLEGVMEWVRFLGGYSKGIPPGSSSSRSGPPVSGNGHVRSMSGSKEGGRVDA